ncbi:MAG: hypothetical protein JWO62_405 [Acidimicrobiaceae bacterium]|nr:hypothetical protein [Acidimicrobiaceae bacterium]
MTDIVVRPKRALAFGSDTPSAITISPGGSATNQAVWLARAGAEVHLVAAIGDDEQGSAAERTLERAGVHTHLQRIGSRSTGTVVSLVDDHGQRSMLNDRGANLALTSSALPLEIFEHGCHLHLSGYELLDGATRALGLAALGLAAEHKMTRSVDPCSAGPLAHVGAEAFLSWTSGVELFCGNLDEGRVLTGAEDPLEVADALSRSYGEVALTLGAEGALWTTDGSPAICLPATPTKVVDTTGAGDSFTGTFLAGWLAGSDPGGALQDGLDMAAAVVAEPGARSWF